MADTGVRTTEQVVRRDGDEASERMRSPVMASPGMIWEWHGDGVPSGNKIAGRSKRVDRERGR